MSSLFKVKGDDLGKDLPLAGVNSAGGKFVFAKFSKGTQTFKE